jgi:uncharacterized protein YndB with AHSA1/START domain
MTNALTVTAPEGLPYIDTEREFDAPVDAVFRAHKDPELLKQWMGPDGYEMEIERHDFVTQGGYRFVHRDPQGEEYAFNGTFHTVRDNDFAIQTFEYDGAPDAHAVYPSVETRDAMAASGMEKGMIEGYDKLEALVASVGRR